MYGSCRERLLPLGRGSCFPLGAWSVHVAVPARHALPERVGLRYTIVSSRSTGQWLRRGPDIRNAALRSSRKPTRLTDCD